MAAGQHKVDTGQIVHHANDIELRVVRCRLVPLMVMAGSLPGEVSPSRWNRLPGASGQGVVQRLAMHRGRATGRHQRC
ncbi:MAG: hypothetical protein R3B90_12390 [Planctomycetaceae bacterium]